MSNNKVTHRLPITQTSTPAPVRLKPVPADYEPAYPRSLSGDEIRDLLRPGLFRRFSPTTMLAGALVAGAMATGCDGPRDTLAGENKTAKSTRTDPKLKAKVDGIVQEVLGHFTPPDPSQQDAATVALLTPLASNPPVKVPSIPISFGTGLVNVFDTEAAKAATHKLFAAYGIELRPDVKVEGDGFAFLADGYDPRKKVGFKLITPSARMRLVDQKVVQGPADRVLEPREIPALDAAVKAGKLNVFVADTDGHYHDGPHGQMRYYLASVIDYLNWIHGDQQIELTRVLGQLPGGYRTRGWRRQCPALPGADFESDADLACWSVAGGKLSVTREWSSFGGQSLRVDLEPGGVVTYTPPPGTTVPVRQEGLVLQFGLYTRDPADVNTNVTFALTGENGQTCRLTGTFQYRGLTLAAEPQRGEERPAAPFKEVAKITITTDSPRPLRFYLDDVGVLPPPTEAERKQIEEEKARVEAEAREGKLRNGAALFERSIDSLPFDDCSLVEAVEFLRDVTGWNVHVNWHALSAAGVLRETTVRATPGARRVDDVLTGLLKSAGPRIQYRVIDDVIHVSTDAALAKPRPAVLPPRGTDSAANDAAVELLRRPLTENADDGVPLSELLEFVHEVTGLKIRPDWPRLRIAGFAADSKVSVHLRNIPCEALLRVVLGDPPSNVPADSPGDRTVQMAVCDGVLVISTADGKFPPPP